MPFGSFGGGATVARATVELIADNTKLRKGFDDAKKQVTSDTDAMSSRQRTMAGVTAAAAAAAGAAIVRFAGQSVTAYREARKVAAETNAAIASTGGVANVSAEDVAGLASEIQNYSGMSDEAIASTQNLLLSFTNVRNEVGEGNDIFSQATVTITDMAAAGYDLRGATIQVGKALQDPVKGATALSRAGVILTDQQREQIKVFVESGDIMSAQKVILEELAVEFGGRAKAMADDGEILNQKFNDMQEVIGRVVFEAGAPLIDFLTSAVNLFNQLPPGIQTGIVVIGGLTVTIGAAVIAIASLRTALTGLGISMHAALGPIGLVTAALSLLVGLASSLGGSVLDELGTKVEQDFVNKLKTGEMSIEEMRAAVEKWNNEVKKSHPEMMISAGAVEQAAAAYIEGAEATDKLAESHEDAAAAAREQRNAELALAGGFLGVKGAALGVRDANVSLAEAEAEVADLAAKGKKGTDEYRDALRGRKDAQLDAIESQISLTEAARTFVEEQRESGSSMAETAALVRAYGEKAGLSKRDVDALVASIVDQINTSKQIPDSKSTRFLAPGLRDVLRETLNWKSLLDRIPSDVTTVMRVRQETGPAPGHVTGVASGGVISGASGFVTRGPTYLVGEGTRQTFAGKGAEAVIPLDGRGVGILAEAVRRGGGVAPDDLRGAVADALRDLFVHNRHLVADLFGPKVNIGRSVSFPLKGAE